MDLDFSKPSQAIRKFRQQHGFSLSNVAEAIGVNRSLLGMVESGKRRLSPKQLHALAHYLDLPDELLRVAMKRLQDDSKRDKPHQDVLDTAIVRQADYIKRLEAGLSPKMRRRLHTTAEEKPQQPKAFFEGRIRAGKNSTTYRAHSYHTKVPAEAIAPIIQHHTSPGDIVLDPFCGSGMTGVAALHVGRHAVLSDLSPAAVHIARNYVTPCRPDLLRHAVDLVHKRVRSTMACLYDVIGTDWARATVEHTVWSDRFACGACSAQWSYWNATKQKVGRTASGVIECPVCGSSHRKQDLVWVGEEPVITSASLAGSRFRDEHPPTEEEIDLIRQAEATPIPYWTPRVDFESGREMWRASHGEMGVRTAADFYTYRNLHALAAIRNAILQEADERLRDALFFAFTGCVNRASRRYQWNKKRPTNVMTGTLYISSLRYEWNVWSLFSRKAADVIRFYESFPATDATAEVVMASATDLAYVPDRSVDFVFMDPPYGSNIFYGDCSLLWEAWLGQLTPLGEEIVVNRKVRRSEGGKDIADYSALLSRAFAEVGRVLKPSARAVLAFSNTDGQVWKGIQTAIVEAGLEITSTATLDKVHRSIKGVQGTLGNELVTRLDLLIGLRVHKRQRSSDPVLATIPLTARVESVLQNASSPMATDEVFTVLVEKALCRPGRLRELSMAEVERVLSDVSIKDPSGRWITPQVRPFSPALTSLPAGSPGRKAEVAMQRCMADEYEVAGSSFEPRSGGGSPKRVNRVPIDVVKGTRNTVFYNAHSYHTKIPPETVMPFLDHFTRPGDVVLDPFAGSGMTGIAASLLGRRCILNDLSVISSHLAFNHTRPCDPQKLETAFNELYTRLLPKFQKWYHTVTKNGSEGYVHYTIWSKVYACKKCRQRFSMWSVTDTQSGRIGPTLRCPACGHEASRQSWRWEANEPVSISYRERGTTRRLEKAADAADMEHIASFRTTDIDAWYPTTEVQSDREMYIRSALHLQGIKTVADFYTPRNLLALATIWKAINEVGDTRIRFVLAFAFTNTAWHGTRMRRYNARGGQRPLTGTLYIPQLSSEVNVLEVMKNKVARLCAYYRAFRPLRDDLSPPLIIRGSATEMIQIPNASVDYIFTDPPFGSNIFYADCNLIWESWLGRVTDYTREAVVNRSLKPSRGGKTVRDYTRLMTDAMREMYRVLKSGGWMTLVFHNTDANIWASIQEAAATAGFRIDGAAGLDREQHSHKGYKGKNGSEKVAHFDVVLSMQKNASAAIATKRRRVTEALLTETLRRAAGDPRVKRSSQWAHSVVIRSLIEKHFDLGDVSYERVHRVWTDLFDGSQEVTNPGGHLNRERLSQV